MTEVLGLTFVAWLVYVSDALWWVRPHRIVLSGREVGRMRAQLGPQYTLRDDSGVFIPKLTPAFSHHFEVSVFSDYRKAATEDVITAAAHTAIAAARPVARLGTLLWGYCFVVAPLLIIALGLRRVWIVLVGALFAVAVGIVVRFARSWRQLHPENAGGWTHHALPMILSPLAAICAADTLTRSALAPFEGLAVVATLAPEEDFLRIARLYYFASERSAEKAVDGEKSRLEALLTVRGLKEALFQPPARAASDLEGYCPRCHTQLVRSIGACPECLDVPIVAFGSPMPSGAPSGRFQSTARR